MSNAIVLRETGAPEVLRLEQLEVGSPQEGEVRLRQTAIGVNFHDVYVRAGLYKTLSLPGIPGVEAVGVIEAIGEGVRNINVGDRVAYVSSQYGGYAAHRLIDASDLLLVPSQLDDYVVAATLVKGLTALMLISRVHEVRSGEVCLVHAAAGGVGRILCEWLTRKGAYVIGAVSTEEKAVRARESGCAVAIVYKHEDFAARVLQLSDGRGASVIYDSVGLDTFEGSLKCLAKRGHLVCFGQSSGHLLPFDLHRLADKSTKISRPILFHYLEHAVERAEMAAEVFEALELRTISAKMQAILPLSEAAEAHRVLESRASTGAMVLVP